MEVKQVFQNDPRLIEFCKNCESKGYLNNRSLVDLKFDYFEHSSFWAGLVNEQIKFFSGVHNFDFDGKRFWRVGFRSVALPDESYETKISRNFLKTSWILKDMLPKQIDWVQKNFGMNEKFVITTNTNADDKSNSKSHVVDREFRRNKYKWIQLIYSDIEYLHTRQNVWLVDVEQLLIEISNFKN